MLRQLQEVLVKDGRLSASDLMRIPTEDPSVAGGIFIFEAAQRGSLNELRNRLAAYPEAVDWHNPDQGCLGSGFEASGATALMAAALRGPIMPVDALLTAGASPSLVERPGGWSAVHYAAWGGHVIVLRRFKRAEALMDEEDELGRTPLYLAVRQGHNQAVRYLLEIGADGERAAKRGFTPLMLASKQNRPQVVRTLIHHGVDVNRAKEDGYTALHLAACNGHADVATLLLALGNASVDARNEEGCTPLMLAAGGCLETNRDAARLLRQLLVAHHLSRGNAAALASSGVLEVLAGALLPNQAHAELIRICLNHGADPSKVNDDKETALMFVASRNELEGLTALLSHAEIRVDQAGKDGWTALMFACRAGHVEAVKALLEAGADPLREKADGFTAKRLAEVNKNEKILKLIEEKLTEHSAISLASLLREDEGAEEEKAPEGAEETKQEQKEDDKELGIRSQAVSLELMVGEGSFGKAYRGKYNEEIVVVKHAAQPGFLNPEQEQEVMRGIVEQMALDSEYVAKVFGISNLRLPGMERSSLCLVMEYAVGGTLAQFAKACRGRGRIAASSEVSTATEIDVHPACVLLMLYEASLGLEHIHQKGMLHRDIKPHNILLGSDLKPRIADFGLAKHIAGRSTNGQTQTEGTAMAFLAPEQWLWMLPDLLRLPFLAQAAVENTASADWYSFGLVMKYVILGIYGTEDIDGAVMDLRSRPFPALPSVDNVAGRLSQVVSRCLEQEPTHRYGPESDEGLLLSDELQSLLGAAGGNPRSTDATSEIRENHNKLSMVATACQMSRMKTQERSDPEEITEDNESSNVTSSETPVVGANGIVGIVDVEARKLMVAIITGDQTGAQSLCQEGNVENLLAISEEEARVTPLHMAAHVGAEWAVDMILQLPLDATMLDARDANGRTPLILAASKGSASITERLLNKGAEVEATDLLGATALSVAAAKGNSAAADALLAKGANVDHREDDQCTPLLNAALGGHTAVGTLLVRKGANPNLAEREGWTALLFACRKGFLPFVKLLVEAGAEIEKSRPNGTTPLCMAAEAGNDDVVEFLLQENADVEKAMQNGATPLCVAAQNGHEPVVRMLLEQGADVDATETKGWTPLLNAAFAEHGGIIKMLIEHGAQLEVRKDGGATPLLVAATRDSVAALQVLLDAGADREAQNDDGLSALATAAHFGNAAGVKILIENGADIESANNEGWRPLHLACLRGHDKVVSILIEHKANVHATKDNGATALHVAAEQGHEAIVRELLRHEVDLEAREDGGWTPLHNAALGGQETIVRLLLESGADATATKIGGLTAEDIAAREGHAEVAQLLRRRRLGLEVESLSAAESKTLS